MKKNSYYTIIGIIFISLSIFLLFFDFLNGIIRPFTQIFLMGSSKGKDILFFAMFGFLILFSQLFEYDMGKFKLIQSIKSIKILKKIKQLFEFKNDSYLKFSIILFLVIGILGLIMEIALRNHLEINIFTIFVAMVPEPTTTSLLHSHIYKSVFGAIFASIVSSSPTGIHIGDSLYSYVPEIANTIIITFPILFLSLFCSLKNRLTPSKLILIFAITCGLIGLVDGGIFATPTIIGIYGFLFVYFEETRMNYYLGMIFKNKSIMNKLKNKINILKENKIKSFATLKRMIPHIFLASIIILGVSLSIIGTNSEYYEVQVMDPHELDLNSYSILEIKEYYGKTIIAISPEYNEMNLLNNLTNSFKNKSSSFSMTFNFFSYF